MLRRRSQRFKDACQTRDWWARGQRGRSRGTPRSFAQQKDVSFRMTSAESDSGAPSLFGLAPCGVCHAPGITTGAVRSYFNSRFIGTAPFHPYPDRSGRYIFCGTFRAGGVRSSTWDIHLQPSPLASTLPCGVRTFLSPVPAWPPKRPLRRGSDHPACSRKFHDSLLSGVGSNQSWRLRSGPSEADKAAGANLGMGT